MDKIKAVFFDIDNTLYDSALQVEMVRRNAIKAMIEAGFEIDAEEGLKALKDIVAIRGSNYQNHFDELLKKYGYEGNPRILAAGIVAYHNTKSAYLVPFPDTIPTLLTLRQRGYKIGVITEGRSVKQWEKLISLGLQHFFHAVLISEEVKKEKPDVELFVKAAQRIGCKPGESAMVGDRLDKDIVGAKAAGMTTIQILKGKYSDQRPTCSKEEPDYIVPDLKGILSILK
ncbi:MAG: TIGR02253 family HAD-type hydrolase [Candidatus Altiarchaeia archaeon]